MASWIIPCNPKYYDIFGAFRSLQTIDWRQTVKNIHIDDTIYIYVGQPVQAITHKCRVVDIDIPDDKMDHSDDCFNLKSDSTGLQPYWRYMRLRLVKEYDRHILSYARLVENGLRGSVQGQRRLDLSVQALINSIDP